MPEQRRRRVVKKRQRERTVDPCRMFEMCEHKSAPVTSLRVNEYLLSEITSRA